MLRSTVTAWLLPVLITLVTASGAVAQDDGGAAQPPQPFTATTVNPDGTVSLAVPDFTGSEGVRNRDHPEYDALGLRVGDLVIYPSVGIGASYNTNVLDTQSGRQADAALDITPMLRVVSDFPRHALQILLYGDGVFYDRLHAQNTTDFTASIDGRIDILHATNLVLNAAYQILNEALGSPDLPANAAKPTQYRLATGQAALNQSFNHLTLSAGASLRDYDYSPTTLTAPALPATVDNHDLDRIELTAFAQGGYEFSPGYSVFLRGSYNDRDYSQTVDDEGVRRGSRGYEADAGVRFELTHLIVGQVYGGYLDQLYDDPAFHDFGGAGFGAQLEWYPTMLTTVRIDVRRTIEETTLVNAASYTDTHFGLGIDHELLRNLILSLDAGYDEDVYNGVVQTDKYWNFRFGAVYLVNRNFQVDAGYVLSRRISSLSGLGYIGHSFELSLVAKL